MSSSKNEKIYLVNGKRTPYGSFGGSLAAEKPVDLALRCSKEAMNDVSIKPDQIDHVIMGNVVPATTDTMYGARHLALGLGCPLETPGFMVNRLCGSGIEAIVQGTFLIAANRADCVLACGVENMSLIPHAVYGARFGQKYGSLKTVDFLLDALTDQYCKLPMGITAENLGEKYSLTRNECDLFALESHQKAAKAYQDNLLQGEVISYELKKHSLQKDEHIREDADLEKMAKLRSNFKENGLVTAANASGIVDGAAAVFVASEKFVTDNKLQPLAQIVDHTVVGVDPTLMGFGPVPAIKQLLEKNSLSLSDIDAFEINEAFAAQALSCQKELEIPKDKLNRWGGAIALGHPLGSSGTRITLTLARQLKHFNEKRGIASACIGGGQGIAILIENLS